MSTINVTNLSGRGGATPNLPDGANVTGVVTATSFDGSLKTTGTPTLGLGVTINASGINVSGVLTATSFKGDGSGLTGVGESIAPWYYNPDVNDTSVTPQTGIGITFNKKIDMGSSGTATLKMVNAGVAGTTIQSWGISSATQSAVTEITLGSLVSSLLINKTYQLDIPEGYVVSTTGTSYAGTAYTFTVQPSSMTLFAAGGSDQGQLAQNSTVHYSSPVQIPGIDWKQTSWNRAEDGAVLAVKRDGTLWAWGANTYGTLGQNDRAHRSSPIQVGSDSTWDNVGGGNETVFAWKTDGTVWGWGSNPAGELGVNDRAFYSSPVQIPGTTWKSNASIAQGNADESSILLKTDGTMWGMGEGSYGYLAQNNTTQYSSPVQVPGTTWRSLSGNHKQYVATKTDGTLWVWGQNEFGALGLNNGHDVSMRSSPTQIPGTNWSEKCSSGFTNMAAIKTDGTLWSWGGNHSGGLGVSQPTNTHYSSPVQIPGTTWSHVFMGHSGYGGLAIKTDGTFWVWGGGDSGQLAQGNQTNYSSPKQVPGTNWTGGTFCGSTTFFLATDTTP